MARTVEIVYPVCCGMDIHKNFLVACIAVTDKHSHTEHHIRRFSTFTGDLRRLSKWLVSNNCNDVCIESSGKYWIPVFNALEKTGINVCLTHPKYVKAIKGKKTDKKDAKWISELFKCDLVRSSFIPPPDIRQLRDLCRYYVKLTGTASGEKNRAQNCLTMYNFKLDDVFADVFGKSAIRVLDALLEHGNGDFELDGLIHGKCKSSPEKIRAALEGELNPAQVEKLGLIRQHMRDLDTLKAALEKLIYKLAAKYQAQIDLLMTVPGIASHLTAIRILAEIGADMSVFETAKQLVSWTGLTPQNQESAGKKSLIAIARKLLTAIWHILSKNEASITPPVKGSYFVARIFCSLQGGGRSFTDVRQGRQRSRGENRPPQNSYLLLAE